MLRKKGYWAEFMCGLVNILDKSKSLTLMHLLSQIMRNEKHFVEGIYESTLKSKISFKAGKFGSTTQIKKWVTSLCDLLQSHQSCGKSFLGWFAPWKALSGQHISWWSVLLIWHEVLVFRHLMLFDNIWTRTPKQTAHKLQHNLLHFFTAAKQCQEGADGKHCWGWETSHF